MESNDLNQNKCQYDYSASFHCRYPPGLRGVSMVSLGLVQRQVWRLRRAAAHTLHPHARSQQWNSLPPAGGREEMFLRQLSMTRPRKEGEERERGEKRAKREKNQEREEGTKKEKQHKKNNDIFTPGINMMTLIPIFSCYCRIHRCMDCGLN